jgi:uncharacterized protein
MLLLHGLPVLHWAVAGVAIGAITLILMYALNRRLGISTGFESVCALVSKRPYFRRSELQGKGRWRLPFLAGLVAGGVVSALLGGGFAASWDLGRFDVVIGASPLLKTAWMFAGGLLIGFGTRLAGGCTSGHGIFGMANFEKASWLSTASFMAAGIATTQIVYRVVF